MTIANAREKCKKLAAKAPRDAIILTVLVLSTTAGFGLGFLAGADASRPAGEGSGILQAPPTGAETATAVVASRSGTRYYPPSCPAAGRISAENKIWFVSAAAAQAAGYSAASNCP